WLVFPAPRASDCISRCRKGHPTCSQSGHEPCHEFAGPDLTVLSTAREAEPGSARPAGSSGWLPPPLVGPARSARLTSAARQARLGEPPRPLHAAARLLWRLVALLVWRYRLPVSPARRPRVPHPPGRAGVPLHPLLLSRHLRGPTPPGAAVPTPLPARGGR